MLYPFAMLALAALFSDAPAAAFDGPSPGASNLLHHVAGRPQGGIGGNRKRQAEDQAAPAEDAEPAPATDDALASAEVEALFKGHTAYGFMVDNTDGPFREYFAGDGALRGQDSLAAWSVEDDALCVKNDGEEKQCFKVRRLPDETFTLEDDGKVWAYLKVAEGNPFEF